MSTKKIVICGATGHQGGAALESISNTEQWEVVAISRSPHSAKAEAITARGIKVVQANFQDRGSLVDAFSGAYGVFGVTQPFSPDFKTSDTDAEIQHGHNIIDACLETDVSHLVFSSVAHLDIERTGVSHVDSKIELEHYLEDSGQPFTVLQPASFMDNIGSPFVSVKKNRIRGFTAPDAKVPYVACKDIGEFAALALANPDQYLGKKIELVADFVSGVELAHVMDELREGEHFKYSAVPKIMMRVFAKEFYRMRLLFEEWGTPPYPEGIAEAMEACKDRLPEITTMKGYLQSHGYDHKQL